MSEPQRVVGVQVEIEGDDLSPEEIMRQVTNAQFDTIAEAAIRSESE